MYKTLVLTIICLFGFTANAYAQEQTISFLPHWIDQAQFAGYYVALDKGLYEKHGIKVNILHGGPDAPPSHAIENGSADIVSTFLTTAIKKRAEGVRLVNISQLAQRSSLMLVAKKSSGINSVQDLNGKKVGLWGEEFHIQPKALFRKFNLRVQEVPQSVNVNLFLKDGVDVASAVWYNEYHTIINSGVDPEELTTIFYDNYGLSFPEDGLYCLEKTLQSNPERICNFVQASLEGWTMAFENPDEALQIVMKYVETSRHPSNRAHQRWMLMRMKDLFWPDGNKEAFGKLREADYRRVGDEMLANGDIQQVEQYQNFVKSCEAYVKR